MNLASRKTTLSMVALPQMASHQWSQHYEKTDVIVFSIYDSEGDAIDEFRGLATHPDLVATRMVLVALTDGGSDYSSLDK